MRFFYRLRVSEKVNKVGSEFYVRYVGRKSPKFASPDSVSLPEFPGAEKYGQADEHEFSYMRFPRYVCVRNVNNIYDKNVRW